MCSMEPQLKPWAAGWQRQLGGDLEGAERLYEQALERSPDDAETWHRRGLAAFQRKDFPLAIEYLLRAVALDPQGEPYYVNLGAAQRAAGRLKDAEASYRRVLTLNPRLTSAYNNLSN